MAKKKSVRKGARKPAARPARRKTAARTSKKPSDPLLAAIKGVVRRVPEVERDVVTYSTQKIRDVGAVNEGHNPVRSDGFDVVQAYLTDFWPAHLAALKRASERAARGAGHG